MPKVPDMPVNPPEPDDATWEKNNRNSIREEVIEALGTVISRLDELDWDESTSRGTQSALLNLMIKVNEDMED